jgi:membrane associated rhomboid family serine protease
VEKLYGSAKFVVFWVVTGIMGVVGSYLSVQPRLATGGMGRFLFKNTDVASAGASGALFGLVGVLFIFGIKFRRELPEGFRRAFGTGMLPIIIINLFIGYVGRGFIDNAAHLGGLLSGAALATVVVYRRPGERRGIASAWRILKVATLAIIVLAFYKTARNFNYSIQLAHVPTLSQEAQIFFNYVAAMSHLRNKAEVVVQSRDLSDVSTVSQQAMQAPAPDERADELRQRLLSILSRMTTAVASASPAQGHGPVMPPALDEKLVAEFEQWKIDYDQWLSSGLKK